MIALKESLYVKSFDFDPNATTAVDVGYVDMQDFESFMVGFFRTVGTSATTLKIYASSAANGGSPVLVKTHAVAAEPDAVGDQLYLEINKDELSNAGANLRYVNAQLTFATATDEGVVSYIFGNCKNAKLNRTADIVA